MNILAFDTSYNSLQICLKYDDLYYENYREIGLKHSELLMTSIDSILKEVEAEIKDLNLLVCGKGPGSFTGIRIGISTMKGLASALEIPFKTISLLDVYGKHFQDWPGSVIAVLDARKNKYYGGHYKKGDIFGTYFDLSKESIFSLGEIDFPLLITGPDSSNFNDQAGSNISIDKYSKRAMAKELLLAGVNLFEKEGFDDPSISPLYIRKSDAELLKKK